MGQRPRAGIGFLGVPRVGRCGPVAREPPAWARGCGRPARRLGLRGPTLTPARGRARGAAFPRPELGEKQPSHRPELWETLPGAQAAG